MDFEKGVDFFLVKLGKTLFYQCGGHGEEQVTVTSSISKAWKTTEYKTALTGADCLGGEVVCYEIKERPLPVNARLTMAGIQSVVKLIML